MRWLRLFALAALALTACGDTVGDDVSQTGGSTAEQKPAISSRTQTPSAQPEEEPVLEEFASDAWEGQPYLTLRDAMLEDGWTPVAGACQGVFDVPCEDFPEIENCTGTGLGFCDMTFERNQSCLSVVITDGPPSLEDRQDAPVYSTRKYAKPCRSNPVLGDSQT